MRAAIWRVSFIEANEAGRTPLVLGGDHSIAVGTVSGMSEELTAGATRGWA